MGNTLFQWECSHILPRLVFFCDYSICFCFLRRVYVHAERQAELLELQMHSRTGQITLTYLASRGAESAFSVRPTSLQGTQADTKPACAYRRLVYRTPRLPAARDCNDHLNSPMSIHFLSHLSCTDVADTEPLSFFQKRQCLSHRVLPLCQTVSYYRYYVDIESHVERDFLCCLRHMFSKSAHTFIGEVCRKLRWRLAHMQEPFSCASNQRKQGCSKCFLERSVTQGA